MLRENMYKFKKAEYLKRIIDDYRDNLVLILNNINENPKIEKDGLNLILQISKKANDELKTYVKIFGLKKERIIYSHLDGNDKMMKVTSFNEI